MPKHLFAETIFTQPTCVIDLIQSYSLWAEKNIDYRTVFIVRDLNEEVVEYIEEYVIEDANLTKDHMITVKTVIYPKNPSIVILESLGSNHISSSKVNMIINDYDQTYLSLPQSIKITAGRNVITDMPGNNQSDPSNPNDPNDPSYNNTLDYNNFNPNWDNATAAWKTVYVDHTGNLGQWSNIGTMDWQEKVNLTQSGQYETILKNNNTGETLTFYTSSNFDDIKNMQKHISQTVPKYGEEMETYFP